MRILWLLSNGRSTGERNPIGRLEDAFAGPAAFMLALLLEMALLLDDHDCA